MWFFRIPLPHGAGFGIAGCWKVASKLPTKSTRFVRFAIFDFRDLPWISGMFFTHLWVFLRVFVRGKDWQRALQVLIDLRGNGAANDVSYGAAISACESSEEWQTAIVLLTEACLVKYPEVVFFCFFHVCSLHGTRCSMYGKHFTYILPSKTTIGSTGVRPS